MPNDLISDVRALIRRADFIPMWPAEVKRVLAKALKTDGPIPAYAVKQITWAMRDAEGIERKMVRQLAAGNEVLKQPSFKHLLPKVKAEVTV